MAIPKKSNAAAAQQLRSTKGAPKAIEKLTARNIFAEDKPPREKITLTMNIALKRKLKIAAATEGVTISELVELWAQEWLDNYKQ